MLLFPNIYLRTTAKCQTVVSYFKNGSLIIMYNKTFYNHKLFYIVIESNPNSPRIAYFTYSIQTSDRNEIHFIARTHSQGVHIIFS